MSSSLIGYARRKAPGSDGLPAKFYIRFWGVLGADLVDLFNLGFSVVFFFTRSQRRGVISVTFKKGAYIPGECRLQNCLQGYCWPALKVIHFVVMMISAQHLSNNGKNWQKSSYQNILLAW